MKAITIWQPWASLLACDAKQFETRGWATSYRGPIAIHAGKGCYGPYACELPIGFTEAAVNALWPGVTDPCACEITDNWDELPRGAIIATGDLIGCWEIDSIQEMDGAPWEIGYWDDHWMWHDVGEQELLFGDWTPGRYAWEIRDVQMLPEPVPAKGKQRLWNWEAPHEKA